MDIVDKCTNERTYDQTDKPADSWARTSPNTEAYATTTVYKQIASFRVSECRFGVSPVNFNDPKQKIERSMPDALFKSVLKNITSVVIITVEYLLFVLVSMETAIL